VFSGVTNQNHGSLSGNPMDESGFGGCQENGTCLSVKFGGGGIMVWGCFLGIGLGSLVPVKRTLNASAYNTFWTILGMAPSCSKMTVHKSRSIKT